VDTPFVSATKLIRALRQKKIDCSFVPPGGYD
jgi:hypothetical protein